MSSPSRSRVRRLAIGGFPLLVAAAAILALVLVNRDETPDAAVLYAGPVRFFDIETGYIQERADELGIDIVLLDGGWDPALQLEQVRSLAISGVEVIAIASVDPVLVAPAADIAAEHGAQVLSFTNRLDADGVPHVGRNERTSGELLGEQIAGLDRTRNRIFSVEGAPGTEPQQLRSAGLRGKIDIEPGWELVGVAEIEGWRLDLINDELVQQIISSRPDVVAVQWADAATLLSQLLRDRDVFDIRIVSLELTHELAAEMTHGIIASTTYASIRTEANETVDAIGKLLDGETPEAFEEVDEEIVTPDDLGNVTIEW